MRLIALLLLGIVSVACAAETPPRLPASCLLDFSRTLEKPAGQHGFLTVGSDGHFHWQDGPRARFWGINVSSTRLDIPPEQIEQTVETFARAGLNMVRLEAIDNRNCLLGDPNAPDSRHLDKRYLDRLDHWMDALRRHGLYYYLDLLDFRTFKTGDNVLNADSLDRGARPYALFDPYLIQLQKEYARQLLTHRNPYSGLRPIDDPALALVEICNEHGFFLYPDKLEAMVEPYRSNLRDSWNDWLRTRYTTREKLASAWMQVNGAPALTADEDPNANTVRLPLLTNSGASVASVEQQMRRCPARMRDGVQFLMETQRAYFREMRSALRGMGLRVPVTAVVSNDIVPDLISVAKECDFMAENWYGSGSNADPRDPGALYYNDLNPLRDDSPGGFAPYTAALRWNHKPVVVREWAVSWPNTRRAASVPEALAYGALQDYDALLLFGYQTNRAPNGAHADALNEFAFQSDPTVWGLYALAGQAFLSGALRPAAHTVTLAFPPWRWYGWPSGVGDLHRAAWCVRLNCSTEPAGNDPNALTPTGTPRDLSRLRQRLTRLEKPAAPLIGPSFADGIWRSDTGQIVLHSHEGRLEVHAPRLRMLAGELESGRIYDLGGGLRFTTPTRFGALLALSLDGLPVERSRHILVKMVSQAKNTGELSEKVASPFGMWALRRSGSGPVVTSGRLSTLHTQLWFETPRKKGAKPATRPLLSLPMADGTWEMEIQDGQIRLACDTPGLTGWALGRAFTTIAGVMEIAPATADNRTLAPLVH